MILGTRNTPIQNTDRPISGQNTTAHVLGSPCSAFWNSQIVSTGYARNAEHRLRSAKPPSEFWRNRSSNFKSLFQNAEHDFPP